MADIAAQHAAHELSRVWASLRRASSSSEIPGFSEREPSWADSIHLVAAEYPNIAEDTLNKNMNKAVPLWKYSPQTKAGVKNMKNSLMISTE